MKKIHWIIIVIVVAAALLFAGLYTNHFKHYVLPNGNAPTRPAQ